MLFLSSLLYIYLFPYELRCIAVNNLFNSGVLTGKGDKYG